ncbi:MAG: hypothetical protein J5713_04125, partial [Clostridia bacterium]|nr:hypothetical protein [Clostridia bacterium]
SNEIIINGGTFNGSMAPDGVSAGYVACGIYVANDDTVVVNGGTFNIADGVGIVARSGNTTVGANVVFNMNGNRNLGKIGDSRIVIPSGNALVLDLAANYPGGDPTLTNNSSYQVAVVVENVADVEANKSSASKIILGADIAYNDYFDIVADTTIDLNGHTLSTSACAWIYNGATLTLCDSAGGGKLLGTATGSSGYAVYVLGTLNLLSGTIQADTYAVINGGGTVNIAGGELVAQAGIFQNSGTSTVSGGAINAVSFGLVLNDGTATISGGTITTGETGAGVKIAGGTANIEGGTISAKNGVLFPELSADKVAAVNVTGGSINGTSFGIVNNGNNAYGTTMNISGGNISGAIGIYHAGRGTLAISGDAHIEGNTALYIKSGNVTIGENAEFEATLTTFEPYTYLANGCQATGDAIVIDNCDYPGGNAVVQINGENVNYIVAAEGAHPVATYAPDNSGN